MQVSKEEILHIANLANLYIEDNEVDKYLENLQDILDFANFGDLESLLQNAPDKDQNMFKIPKVIN